WTRFLTAFVGGTVTASDYGVTFRGPDHFGEKYWMGSRYGALPNRYSCGGFGAPYQEYPGAMPTVGETHLLVTRAVNYDGTSIYVTTWNNPILTNAPVEAEGTTMFWSTVSGSGIRCWDTVSLVANAGVAFSNIIWFYVDELRLGEYWYDVMQLKGSPVERPTNVSPAGGATAVALAGPLQGSAFASTEPNDVHAKSQFYVRSANGISWTVETNALTQISLPAGVLDTSTRYVWRVRYLGTNSVLWSDWSEETGFETVWGGGKLICYDGAAYPETPFPEAVGGKSGGFGWGNIWQYSWVAAGCMRVAADSPGLMYKFIGSDEWLSSTNNRFRTDERGKNYEAGTEERILGYSDAGRQIGTDRGVHLLTPSNTYGKTGTTNWFSFIARYESGSTAARYGLALTYTLSGSAGYNFLIGKPLAADNWGLIGAGGAAGVTVTSGVSAVDGSVAFLVARIIFGDATETAHLWVNPSTRTEPLVANATVLNGVPNFEFDYLHPQATTQSDGTPAPRVGIDEIRFGDTWDAVMPLGAGPPPVVGQPTNIAPADASINVPVTPVIQLSAFNGAGPGDGHKNTEVQFTSFDGIVSSVVTGGLTTFQVPAGVLGSSTHYTWQARYLGTNQPAWSEWSAATAFSTAQGAPRLLSYEGASYPFTTNGIQNRNGGNGWADPWEGMWYNYDAINYVQTRVNVTEPGLTYSDVALLQLVSTSNRFVTSDFGNYQGTDFDVPASRSRRTIGKDGALHLLDVSNWFGVTGTTNWFSFLARYESGDSGAGSYFGLELAGDGTAEKQSSRFVIGKPSNSDNWGFRASDGTEIASSANALSGTSFLVARVMFGDGGEAADLWVDPALGATPPATPSVSMAAIPNFSYSRVGIVSVSTGSKCALVGVDEVRVGEDWASVTPVVPEPAAAVAVLIGLALVRRKR
ncbi:hypothetical protein GX586_16150, partial [bacterium]|nr:hypothetical protein [bacterium]